MFGWKSAKFLMSFSKPQATFSSNFKWLFSVMKDNSSVPFWVKGYILCIKGTNQSAHFGDFLVLESKLTKFLSFLKQQIGFSSKFTSVFNIIRHNSSVLLSLKFYILSTKGAHQSTNLVKFHLDSQNFSEILHFDGLLLNKSYKVSAKKVQKSYLSWHWRVIQILNKNWLVVSNMT